MNFLQKYFIEPIYLDTGFNVINTITYALIAFLALIGIYKVLQKLNFTINKNFFYAIFPFIVFGSSLRAFVDKGIYKIGFWTVTPGIYLLTAAIFLSIFFLSVELERLTKGKIAYWKPLIAIGTIILITHISLVVDKLQFTNSSYGLIILALAILISLILFVAFKFAKFTAGLNYFIPFPAHMLDAATTFVAVDFLGAVEKHPLPVFATSIAGTAAIMFILKLIVLIPLVYFLNKEFRDKNFVFYLTTAIAVLGFAEGIRNLISLILL
ncbi:MAG: DUF63 family protein [Candidatus Nanoarchaeia archaeon]